MLALLLLAGSALAAPLSHVAVHPITRPPPPPTPAAVHLSGAPVSVGSLGVAALIHHSLDLLTTEPTGGYEAGFEACWRTDPGRIACFVLTDTAGDWEGLRELAAELPGALGVVPSLYSFERGADRLAFEITGEAAGVSEEEYCGALGRAERGELPLESDIPVAVRAECEGVIPRAPSFVAQSS